MVGVTYDFGILGDSQPEGLLVSAGLARKGFSVVVIPSSVLGEVSPEHLWPLQLPAQIGSKRLNDLLFRAGFFRLEESGLMSAARESQTILPKHRFLFDGSRERLEKELDREFPEVAKELLKIWDLAKKSHSKALDQAAEMFLNLQKNNVVVRNWIQAELALEPRTEIPLSRLKAWLSEYTQGTKAFRVDPKLKQPFATFLSEHARKWGVQIWNQSFELKSSWGLFHLSENTRVKHLVLNGYGAGRFVSKVLTPKVPDRIQYWMYLDTFETPLSTIPEPFHEKSSIDFHLGIEGAPTSRFCYVNRDYSRKLATVSIGSWLPFDDNKAWLSQIERGRKTLLKLMPFLSEDVFKTIPALLECAELKGDCVRRGEVDRLLPYIEKQPGWKEFVERAKGWFIRSDTRPQQIAKRIYSVSPHSHPRRNRYSSFEAALNLIDFFDKKRRELSP